MIDTACSLVSVCSYCCVALHAVLATVPRLRNLLFTCRRSSGSPHSLPMPLSELQLEVVHLLQPTSKTLVCTTGVIPRRLMVSGPLLAPCLITIIKLMVFCQTVRCHLDQFTHRASLYTFGTQDQFSLGGLSLCQLACKHSDCSRHHP
ncbi:hypothetical protein KC19_VG079800 [Ceratodon purpureus]|uniref:Secreted protein n=1 Tax=Ceratodon purpureus TaxID=3225 RepID=A0A8T0HN66_CERPU|nr:hypothetical protein KC19_VG079800 [Ceratodon purpureus]